MRPPPAKVRSPKPEGASAPPNLRAKATEVVAPPVIPLIIPPPPPVVVATRPDEGNASHSGNADIRGPGTGAGGEGNGTGSGRYGDGDGGGGTAPRQIRGRLKDSDYARSAVEAGVGGTVGVRFMVETDGRVSDCEVDHSSGNIALDNTTCRLIQERFRFDPARDEEGRPVPSTIIENHSWIFEPRRRTAAALGCGKLGWTQYILNRLFRAKSRKDKRVDEVVIHTTLHKITMEKPSRRALAP